MVTDNRTGETGTWRGRMDTEICQILDWENGITMDWQTHYKDSCMVTEIRTGETGTWTDRMGTVICLILDWENGLVLLWLGMTDTLKRQL
jgi:hypothetical protein